MFTCPMPLTARLNHVPRDDARHVQAWTLVRRDQSTLTTARSTVYRRPAGTATIAGGGADSIRRTITVVDTDGTLQFDAPFTMNSGAFNNNGHTIFNSDATVAAAATFTMGATGSDLTVGPDAEVTITQNSFNLDGGVAGETVITVNEGGTLTLDLGDYDNDTATNSFDGVINLNSGGTFDVNVADPRFVMNGTRI